MDFDLLETWMLEHALHAYADDLRRAAADPVNAGVAQSLRDECAQFERLHAKVAAALPR